MTNSARQRSNTLGRSATCEEQVVGSLHRSPRAWRLSCHGFVWLLWLGLFVGTAYADATDPTTIFEQANKLYEQGQYADAAAEYELILKSGRISSPLYFNYANALFKSGQIGRAILNYHLAERLAPRDPDIRANLRFAREAVSGASMKWNRWREWLRRFTLNELTAITAAAIWIWFALLSLGQFRQGWRRNLKGYTSTAGTVSVFLSIVLAVALSQRVRHPLAVVVVPEAVVRYGPLDESQSFYTLHDGAELAVLDKKDSWLRVQDGLGRIGWLRFEHVMTISPAVGARPS
jgi:tetratricopeptide (TPR) repeat protein